MKTKLLLFWIVFGVFSCKKEDVNPLPEAQESIIPPTKIGNSNSLGLFKPLNVNMMHPETMKIINTNGKYYFITSFADIQGSTYDYLRSFEIDTTTGVLNENTTSFLGSYEEVEFPKSPFFYEDLNGDGIKDLFEVDHGKETIKVNGVWPGYKNHLFYGTPDGKFKIANVHSLTDTIRFHHNASIGDIDNDGDQDLLLQAFSQKDEMILFKNNSGLSKSLTLAPLNSTGAVLMDDVDGDSKTDMISAPYIDGPNIIMFNNSGVKIKQSVDTPFGAGFGCYKIFKIKKTTFYCTENGKGKQKLFKSLENDATKISEVVINNNDIRDVILTDLNQDGNTDILFIPNKGIMGLNYRTLLNNGDNTFTTPKWSIDDNLKGYFLPIIITSNRIKFLYIDDFGTQSSRIIDVYTK
jgi:hypothetical protein